MPRTRNPNRDRARAIWLKSDKAKPLKDIATELGVSASTIRKWKSTDHWDDGSKRSAPIKTERYDSMRKNKNAAGNHGGAPPANKNAVTHGLFAKWLPDETGEILDVVEQQTPADIIWQNIILQYTAIIRAQKLMFVNNQDNTSDTVSSDGEVATSFAIQYAWDKQANFMAAQSRAMGTLSNLIKQFVALSDETDIRRQRLELMKAQVNKVSAEVAQINKDNSKTGDVHPIIISATRMNGDEQIEVDDKSE